MSIESTRELAEQQVRDLLGIDANTTQLFNLAAKTFGHIHADRCRELAGWARLTRRSMACSSVAEVIAASRRLEANWWEVERDHMNVLGHWELGGTPQALLERGSDPKDLLAVGSSLGLLGSWACDDAADAEWGRPVDFIDMNDQRPNDRVRLPEGVRVGDRLLVTYEPGCRIWLDVVEHNAEDPALENLGLRRGRLGSVLVGDYLSCEAANAGWAWGMATNGGPVRLPGEDPGTPSDPFNRLIPQSVALRLYDEAGELGAPVEVLGEPWKTIGELLEAAIRLGWPYPDSVWHRWCRTVDEVVDGISP
jgi:hypothetical protein